MASLASSIELYVVISVPSVRWWMCCGRAAGGGGHAPSPEALEKRLEPRIAAGHGRPVVVDDLSATLMEGDGEFAQADVDDPRRRREQPADRRRRRRRRPGRRIPAAQDGEGVAGRRGVVAEHGDA